MTLIPTSGTPNRMCSYKYKGKSEEVYFIKDFIAIVTKFMVLQQELKKQRHELMKEIRKNNRELVFGAKRDFSNNLSESSDDERNRGDDLNNARPSQ